MRKPHLSILWLILVTLALLVLAAGCSSRPSAEETRKYADQMTENILLAMNDDNYARFSQDFDEQMKAGLSEAQYKSTIPAIKAKVGKYISKEFVATEKKDQYIVAVYKAKFSQEQGDVLVRTVFSDKGGKKYVSGFWLDSPKLRGN